MNFMKTKLKGLLLCLSIAIPSWFLGKTFPIIGGAVIAILLGMIVSLFVSDKQKQEHFSAGITFTSKKVLQWAVILLGFGLNLTVIFETGKQSLPIIVCTIATSLLVTFALHKILHIPTKIATLIGVGSSICGGSAIAATAPVIKADDEEVAQAISVIFFFNVIAALIFPSIGKLLAFTTTDGMAFGIFAGTAINDTSSVTAAASTWDTMWNLGSLTLDTAVTVKLTRTLAIIPITLCLGMYYTKKESANSETQNKIRIKNIFPTFILYFILASFFTTLFSYFTIDLIDSISFTSIMKNISKFFIILAMAAIGLNTNIVKLVKSGGKPILLGFCCWIGILLVSLLMQHILCIW